MMDIEKLKKEIVEKLQPLNPEKIILFGSYAIGNPTENSDLDLYIVTSDEFIPRTWREKMNIKLRFSRKLRDIKEVYDIDLIVHTKQMYEKFLKLNSMFAKEILSKGKIIYEKK